MATAKPIQMQTLYKRDSKGKIREWRCELEGDRYRTVAGVQGGNQVTSSWTYAKPKNVGRSNETTAVQQAESEAQSKYDKKLAQGGYSYDVPAADAVKAVKAMLANKFNPKADYDYPVMVQPKLDGIRCLANAEGLWTRNGKPITSCPHIIEGLAELFDSEPNLTLDGELYNHEHRENFNAIVSAVRKHYPSQESELVEYHVYDVVDPESTAGYEDRKETIQDLFDNFGGFVKVRTDIASTLEQVMECHGFALGEGFEGSIIRLRGVPYEYKRSKSLLKHKDFDTDEFEILDVLEGVGNRGGMAGKVVLQLPNGNTCEAGIAGGVDFYKHLLKAKSKYKTATVRYFGYTPDGKLRFGVVLAVFEGDRDV